MPEYIEREALLKRLDRVGAISDFGKYLIEIFPAADVAPVRHGSWIVRHKGMNNWVDCSECGTVGSPGWKLPIV